MGTISAFTSLFFCLLTYFLWVKVFSFVPIGSITDAKHHKLSFNGVLHCYRRKRIFIVRFVRFANMQKKKALWTVHMFALFNHRTVLDQFPLRPRDTTVLMLSDVTPSLLVTSTTASMILALNDSNFIRIEIFGYSLIQA